MDGEGAGTSATIGIETLLKLIDDLPTVPETLVCIWRIVDDPNSTCDALAEVVRLDAPLSAKVLRLVNSPYYANSGPSIADVSSAVSVLGFETIKHLAICISVATNLVRETARRGVRVDYRALWRHSVAAGVTAKQLAIFLGDRKPEEAFTAGLLHDLGKFAILVAMPGPYARVLDRRRRDHRPLVDVEIEELGFDHALAGERFGRAWHFPELLTESARWHHGPHAKVQDGDYAGRLRAIVALADCVAHALDPPASDLGYDPHYADTGLLMGRLGLASDVLDQLTPRLLDEMARARAYLDIV